MTHQIRYAARTDRGLLRSNNQDSVFAGERLLIIADGMGGHAAGDVASRLVVAAFVPLDELPFGADMRRPLIDATREGNAAIADMVEDNPEFDGMGTTLTALLFDGSKVALAHVGDSRAYLYRNGVLHQISHDDTFVQSLVDEGRITSDEAAHHPQRSLLLRALNGSAMDPAITFREVSPGDRFLICSDGLSDYVAPESIADTLAGPDPDEVADTLIQLALVAGGPDNVTVIVADVIDTGITDGNIAGAQTVAIDLDPEATGPMQPIHLTQKMPRVPLPAIPEEPAAAPVYADEDADDGEFDDSDLEDGDESAGDYETDDTTDTAGGDGPRAAPRTIGPPARPRRRWKRWGALTLALIVLAAVALTGSYLWTRSRYFVGNDNGVVAVFRGVSGSVLGLRLASAQENSCGPAPAPDCVPMAVKDLTQSARDQVNSGIPAADLAGARQVIGRLQGQLLPTCPTVTTSSISISSPSTPVSSAPVSSLPVSSVPRSSETGGTGTDRPSASPVSSTHLSGPTPVTVTVTTTPSTAGALRLRQALTGEITLDPTHRATIPRPTAGRSVEPSARPSTPVRTPTVTVTVTATPTLTTSSPGTTLSSAPVPGVDCR